MNGISAVYCDVCIQFLLRNQWMKGLRYRTMGRGLKWNLPSIHRPLLRRQCRHSWCSKRVCVPVLSSFLWWYIIGFVLDAILFWVRMRRRWRLESGRKQWIGEKQVEVIQEGFLERPKEVNWPVVSWGKIRVRENVISWRKWLKKSVCSTQSSRRETV